MTSTTNRFVATINTPGYLPDTADEPATFDTALEAWSFLLDERRSAEDEAEVDGYSGTYNTIECIVAGNLDPADAGLDPTNMTGSIMGNTPGCECYNDLGLVFSVDLIA